MNAPATPAVEPTGPRAAQIFLHSLIDYAGLFPPARLPMETAVRNYAAYTAGPRSWMLGRFICPVSRLEEFRRAAVTLLPRSAEAACPPGGAQDLGGWPISALLDGDIEENLDEIFAFNHEHQSPRNGLAEIDAVELKVTGAAAIDDAVERIPDELFPFFEIDPTSDVRGTIAALSGADAAAKIRTGGITAAAFPSCEQVASFLIACAAAEVPFKATAGLHHCIRGQYPLTYEPGSDKAAMHGFVNVFVAACLARCRDHDDSDDHAVVSAILAETDAAAFAFVDEGLKWRHLRIPADRISFARDTFARSYGSCSFDEPVDELTKLRLI